MAYHFPSCDTYISTSSSEIFRLNLEQGRFLNTVNTSTTEQGNDCLAINPQHQLIACGTDGGCVELFDPRTRNSVGVLNTRKENIEFHAVSGIGFKNDGLTMAAGTSSGYTRLYDLRSTTPLLQKDQGYGDPVKDIIFVENNSELILTSDSKIIKIWDINSGDAFANMEPSERINSVDLLQNTGLIFVANEGPDMHSYFIPRLGPAPKWAMYLDSVTEEMAEDVSKHTIYDNYRFVTRADLEELGLESVLGTSAVKPYMHGYFLEQKVYDEAKAIINPNAVDDYRKKRIKEKINKERETRIRSAGQKAKVNKALAEKFEAKKDGDKGVELDKRFASVFEDEDFAVDGSSSHNTTGMVNDEDKSNSE